MKNRWVFATVLGSALLLLAGCLGSGHWLVGKWQFDAEQTKMANREILTEDTGPVLSGIKRVFGGAVEGIMTAYLDGAVLEFTGSEMRTIQGDTGNAVKYEVIEKPDGNTVVIRRADGKIETYRREGGRIWFKPSETVNLKVYLKPAG